MEVFSLASKYLTEAQHLSSLAVPSCCKPILWRGLAGGVWESKLFPWCCGCCFLPCEGETETQDYPLILKSLSIEPSLSSVSVSLEAFYEACSKILCRCAIPGRTTGCHGKLQNRAQIPLSPALNGHGLGLGPRLFTFLHWKVGMREHTPWGSGEKQGSK